MQIENLYKGRINRRNLIFGLLSSITAIFLIASILIPILGKTDGFIIIFFIFLAFALIFNVSLFVRRWHDLGHSGWMAISNLIPYINIIALLILVFAEGQTKSNQYGPAPSKSINYPADLLNSK